jgi:methyltransferase (TIGR00027 family)
MSQKAVEHKPSETALFAALRRAIANKEFRDEAVGSDDLAEFFLPPHWRFFIRFRRVRANTKDRLDRHLPGLHEYVMARTAYLDRVFVDALKTETPQIVLLGAGYDSRAYRLSQSGSATQVFELDAAPTQNRKLECLRRAHINVPQHVVFVPIDFDRESLRDVLERAGYASGKKTLFIWEGVSYYLEPASVDATLEFVGRSAHHESIIAFDYAISVSEENAVDAFGADRFFQTMREHHRDEGLMFAIDEGEAESFLEERGLRMVEHLDNQEIERTLLVTKDGSSMGRITGVFRFLLASPISQGQ